MNLLKRNMKGITLVALIITIIVLLILAVVAIGIVRGDGILFHAKDATSKYEKDAAEENSAFKSYADMMVDEAGKGPWTQEGMNITDGHISLKVGDKVNYDEQSNGEKSYSIDYTQNGGDSEENNQELKTEDLEWRVLGVNTNGQLELISNKPTTSTLYLKGDTGYLNGPNLLNEACNTLYGQGKYAANGRSLKFEDVLKLADLDLETLRSGHGEKWQYRFSTEAGYMQSRTSTDRGKTWTDWEDITSPYYQKFNVPGEKEINSSNPGMKEIEPTDYPYNLNGIKDETILNLLQNGEDSSEKILQWLASTYISCRPTYVSFIIRTIGGPSPILWDSHRLNPNYSYAMRPVVTIKPSVKIGEPIEGVYPIN